MSSSGWVSHPLRQGEGGVALEEEGEERQLGAEGVGKVVVKIQLGKGRFES